jgi:deoxyribodipyrimidine photo-lyase
MRIRKANEASVNPDGGFVLYWMIAYRRPNWNYSLDRAVAWAKELNKPLVILEALRCGYQWASDRFHQFILDGMAENARRFKKHKVLYYPYVEAAAGEGKGLLKTIAKKAGVVVTDDFPEFFLPRMVSAAAKQIPVLLEQVDSNGLLPMRSADRVFPTAYAFRRFLQKTLESHLFEHPKAAPLQGVKLKGTASIPKEILKKWPMAPLKKLNGDSAFLASLPLDHDVGVLDLRGGAGAAGQVMKEFLERRLPHYPEKRNQPEAEGTSGLSPYLHFGHISVHQIFDELMGKEDWFFDRIAEKATGSRTGWWGMSEAAEAFLDELITWREVGFNMCWQRNDYDRYASLPDWARATLKLHEMDERDHIYALEGFETAATHDPLWNAAQTQLLREGRIHNYLRMLWGKKILEWTPSPRKALSVMIELNNKYAVDGRDPNSYSGIFWVLGRYDRPWGPERPVYGKIRYMSSKNTARKVPVKDYIAAYTP